MSKNLFPEGFLESLGILDWGYTESLRSESFDHFNQWIEHGNHGVLKYLSDHRKDLREDLRKVYPEAQSVLVFLFSYHDSKKWMIENNQHQVAAYTMGFGGEDYHFEVKRRLQTIADFLDVPLQVSLDTHPVLERDLAYRAGLGWFGKNSMLINRRHGSYFIIGSLILNKTLSLESKILETDHCGTCTRCEVACPTKAINLETRTLIADRCISTFTIELMKDASPPKGMENSRGEFFGCDICQDVCPWNKKSLLKFTAVLKLKENFKFLKEFFYQLTSNEIKTKIKQLSNNGFKSLFKGTSFDRPGKKGWLKNFIASQNDS
jgi:epoxyqueuosine reductase